jgi:menaquinone-9 beta-reductase
VPYRYSHTDRSAVYRYMKDPARNELDAATAYLWIDGSSQGFAFPTTPRGSIITMFIADRDEARLAHRDPEAYWQQKLDDHPGARDRLRGASEATALRITDALSSYFRRSSGPGWALIGDAGHFKDPAIGQGIRDALWAGRTVAEAVVDVLHDPSALDSTLRRWEARRDNECMMTYLVGLYHSRVAPGSAGVMDLVRALDEMDLHLTPPLTARDGSIRRALPPRTVARAIIHTLRRSDQPLSSLRDLWTEAAISARLLFAARRSGFRDDRVVAGFENPYGGWPEPAKPAAPTNEFETHPEKVAG